MTGLLNRRGFDEHTRDARPGGAVVACDIDHFKRVNDLFGHAAGDAVIVRIAAILESGLPPGAVPARFGGEEFVVFLPNVGLDAAASIAWRLQSTIERTHWSAPDIDTVTASFGVSATRDADYSPHDAVARADRALYAAKAAGRNRVVIDREREAASLPRIVHPHAKAL